jgi:hypothetical protein
MFFYDDGAGKIGFKSFLGTFNKAQWKIDDSLKEWVVISSIKNKNSICNLCQ